MNSKIKLFICTLFAMSYITISKAQVIHSSDFGADFKWGTATASYQIEGAVNEDGRGASIWDVFSHKKGKIKNGDNADVTVDFYHNYEKDIELLRDLNFKEFRFSIAWCRILPAGTGAINQKGINFYNKVIDKCLKEGITPWITVYHWDLPQALQEKGGWTNRATVEAFKNYTDVISKAFGNKVKNWMVLNEPTVFTAAGYFAGIHAPGEKGLNSFLKAVHHVALAQAEGGRVIRKNVSNANIGTTFSCAYIQPASQKKSDVKAYQKYNAIFNRLFVEPAMGLGYPVDGFATLKKIEKKIAQPGDMEKLAFNFDFIGIQYYYRQVVKHSLWPPILWAKEIKPQERGVASENISTMGWEAYPEGFYHIIKQFAAYKNVKKIYITENGASFTDTVEGNTVNDVSRLNYYKNHLVQVLKAKQEGVPLQGYFAWSLIDNFEWAEGFTPRFGLIHVDYKTQKRTVKNSGYWFQEFLSKK
jgi:beta-glucosidase